LGEKKKGGLALGIAFGESVFIGDDIEIELVRKRGESGVRICVRAPKSVYIERESLRRRRQSEDPPTTARVPIPGSDSGKTGTEAGSDQDRRWNGNGATSEFDPEIAAMTTQVPDRKKRNGSRPVRRSDFPRKKQ
jgi:carbon storage regulator CsrA